MLSRVGALYFLSCRLTWRVSASKIPQGQLLSVGHIVFQKYGDKGADFCETEGKKRSLNATHCKRTFTLLQEGRLSVLIKHRKSWFWWLFFEGDYYNWLLIELGLGERGKMGLKKKKSYSVSPLLTITTFPVEGVCIQVVIALLQHLLAEQFVFTCNFTLMLN